MPRHKLTVTLSQDEIDALKIRLFHDELREAAEEDAQDENLLPYSAWQNNHYQKIAHDLYICNCPFCR